MNLQREYARAVGAQMRKHAVWEPGTPVKLGDYGEARSDVFVRLGNVESDFGVRLESELSPASLWEYTSHGVSTVAGSGSIRRDVASAEFVIKFADSHSLFIRAADSTTRSITNLRAVALRLRELKQWDFSWSVVTSTRASPSFVLLMNSQANASVTLRGSSTDLGALVLGKVASATAIEVSGDAALKILGASGPILLDLIRVNRLFGLVRGATGTSPTLAGEPYEAVEPAASTERRHG